MVEPSSVRMDWEKPNGKNVAPGFHFLAARDFVGSIDAARGRRREEHFHMLFGTVLFGVVSQHKQPGLMILVLPCLQEPVGRGQSRGVAPIPDATRGPIRTNLIRTSPVSTARKGKRRFCLRAGR